MRFIIFFILLSSIIFAQKPARIDEILTNKNTFRLDTTFSYRNIQSIGSLSASQTFQTQNGDFVSIPVYLGATKSNQDYLNMDFTLRYGLTKDIELFTSVNGYKTHSKYTRLGTFQSQSDNGFGSLGIEVLHIR